MNWKKLLVMAVVSFVVMYVLMYMMVDSRGNIFPNLNELYMALTMTGAMVIIEVVLMGSMYGKATRIVASFAGIAMLVIFFLFMRNQTAISDKEFLKSMIPHHGAALLMCERADLHDPEIKNLCASIISSQQREIDWMKEKLLTLE